MFNPPQTLFLFFSSSTLFSSFLLSASPSLSHFSNPSYIGQILREKAVTTLMPIISATNTTKKSILKNSTTNISNYNLNPIGPGLTKLISNCNSYTSVNSSSTATSSSEELRFDRFNVPILNRNSSKSMSLQGSSGSDSDNMFNDIESRRSSGASNCNSINSNSNTRLSDSRYNSLLNILNTPSQYDDVSSPRTDNPLQHRVSFRDEVPILDFNDDHKNNCDLRNQRIQTSNQCSSDSISNSTLVTSDSRNKTLKALAKSWREKKAGMEADKKAGMEAGTSMVGSKGMEGGMLGSKSDLNHFKVKSENYENKSILGISDKQHMLPLEEIIEITPNCSPTYGREDYHNLNNDTNRSTNYIHNFSKRSMSLFNRKKSSSSNNYQVTQEFNDSQEYPSNITRPSHCSHSGQVDNTSKDTKLKDTNITKESNSNTSSAPKGTITIITSAFQDSSEMKFLKRMYIKYGVEEYKKRVKIAHEELGLSGTGTGDINGNNGEKDMKLLNYLANLFEESKYEDFNKQYSWRNELKRGNSKCGCSIM